MNVIVFISLWQSYIVTSQNSLSFSHTHETSFETEISPPSHRISNIRAHVELRYVDDMILL